MTGCGYSDCWESLWCFYSQSRVGNSSCKSWTLPASANSLAGLTFSVILVETCIGIKWQQQGKKASVLF
jgi:hypothetical protein